MANNINNINNLNNLSNINSAKKQPISISENIEREEVITINTYY